MVPVFAQLNFALLYLTFVLVGAFFPTYFVCEVIRIWSDVSDSAYGNLFILVLVLICGGGWWGINRIGLFPRLEKVRRASALSIVLMVMANLFGPVAIATPFVAALVTGESQYVLFHWFWIISAPIGFGLFLLSMLMISKAKAH